MVLYVDCREPGYIAKQLVLRNLDIETKQLECGDYIFGDTVIERKTAQDFCSSIRDTRLWEQLKTMKDNFKNPILLIEGWATESVYKLRSKYKLESAYCTFNYPMALGGLSAVLRKWRIPTWRTEDMKETITLLTVMYLHFKKKHSGRIPLPKVKKYTNIKKIRMTMLSCIPRVSSTLAMRILKEYPIYELGEIMPESLAGNIKGLGLSTAKVIVEVFRKEGGE